MIQTHSPVLYGETAKILSRILDKTVSLVLWERRLPTFADGWLDLIKWTKVSREEFLVSTNNLVEFELELSTFIKNWGGRYPDVTNWVIEDILSLTVDFFHNTGAEAALVTLSPHSQASLQPSNYKKHLKLFATYGQSFAFWLDTSRGKETERHQITPLDVLLLKGESWPGVQVHPLLIGIEKEKVCRSVLLEIEYLN